MRLDTVRLNRPTEKDIMTVEILKLITVYDNEAYLNAVFVGLTTRIGSPTRTPVFTLRTANFSGNSQSFFFWFSL